MNIEKYREKNTQTVQRIKKLVCFVLLALLTVSVSHADETMIGNLLISKPTIPATPPGSKVAAGYLTITNQSPETETLQSIDADFSKKAEIHEIEHLDGVAKMRELKSPLQIAPNQTVALESGSYHLMFMGVSDPLMVGETVLVTLNFERSGPHAIEFLIVDRRTSTHGHMKHDMKANDMKHKDMKMKHDDMEMKHGDTEVN